jgi:hypothetical protein
MKIRDLDLSDNAINKEHAALGIPPVEQSPLTLLFAAPSGLQY